MQSKYLRKALSVSFPVLLFSESVLPGCVWFIIRLKILNGERCMSAGLRFAGTRDGNVQELLYKYAVYFLNEVRLEGYYCMCILYWFERSSLLQLQIKPVCVSNGNGLPKGLSLYVDRGTLETCLHLIVLSLCVVSRFSFFSLLWFTSKRISEKSKGYRLWLDPVIYKHSDSWNFFAIAMLLMDMLILVLKWQ